MLGPLQLERDAVGHGPQPVVAVVVGGDGRLEPHVLELVDRPGGEAVAAGLVAGERLALEDADVVAGLGQPEPGGRSGRARRR